MTDPRTLLAAAALALLPTLAGATSYVMPSDGALADRADVIAHVAYFGQADKDAICTLHPDARLSREECAER